MTSASATTLPRTAIPAVKTVSGFPLTKGCHQAKIPTLGDGAIRTGFRQPMKFGNLCRGQLNTICHQLMAFRISSTTTALLIQQITDDRGINYLVCVFILQLHHATARTAVAQALPLSIAEFRQTLSFQNSLIAKIVQVIPAWSLQLVVGIAEKNLPQPSPA